MDYKVNAQLDFHDERNTFGYVLVRAQDNKNYLAWVFFEYNSARGVAHHAAWYIVQNDEWREIPNSRTEDFPKDRPFSVEVQVKWDVINSYIDGEQAGSWSSLPFPSGKVGAGVRAYRSDATVSIDNFR